MVKIYTLLAESTEPVFDLSALELPGGINTLVVQASDGTNNSDYSDEVQYEQEYENYVVDKATITSIANSVRGKTGKTDPIPGKNISAEIDSIDLGIHPIGSMDITTNDTYNVTDLAEVKVNVPIPSDYKKVSDSTKTITTNGTHSTSKDSTSVYENVKVSVPQPSSYDGSYTTTTTSGQESYTIIDKPDISIPMTVGATFYSKSLYWGGISIDPSVGIVYIDASDSSNRVLVYTPGGGWTDEGYKTIYPSTIPNDANGCLFKGWRADNSVSGASVSVTFDGTTKKVNAGDTITLSCKGKKMSTDVVITRA